MREGSRKKGFEEEKGKDVVEEWKGKEMGRTERTWEGYEWKCFN